MRQLRIVEWRRRVVEIQNGEVAERIVALDRYAGRRLQLADQIEQRPFDPVHLAGLQSRRRGRWVRNELPVHPLEARDLAASPSRRLLLPRNVAIVPGIGSVIAGDEFVRQEAERTTAGRIGDLRADIGLRQPLRTDEAGRGAQPVQHVRVRTLQADLEGLVVDRRHLIQQRGHAHAERIALRPAIDRGDAVDRAHLLAVMEHQAVTQRDAPAQLVVGQFVTGSHLRLHDERLVETEKLVARHVGVLQPDDGNRPHRIEHDQIGIRHITQRVLRGAPDRRQPECCRHGQRHRRTAADRVGHVCCLPVSAFRRSHEHPPAPSPPLSPRS